MAPLPPRGGAAEPARAAARRPFPRESAGGKPGARSHRRARLLAGGGPAAPSSPPVSLHSPSPHRGSAKAPLSAPSSCGVSYLNGVTANLPLSWRLIFLFLFLSFSPPLSLFLGLFLLEIIPCALGLHKSLNPGTWNKPVLQGNGISRPRGGKLSPSAVSPPEEGRVTPPGQTGHLSNCFCSSGDPPVPRLFIKVLYSPSWLCTCFLHNTEQ